MQRSSDEIDSLRSGFQKMLGLKYFAFAAAMILLGSALTGRGDAIFSDGMLNVISAVQVECNQRSTTVGGVQFGCRSFADVRKIEMRQDNRNRSYSGKNIVQIRN